MSSMVFVFPRQVSVSGDEQAILCGILALLARRKLLRDNLLVMPIALYIWLCNNDINHNVREGGKKRRCIMLNSRNKKSKNNNNNKPGITKAKTITRQA